MMVFWMFQWMLPSVRLKKKKGADLEELEYNCYTWKSWNIITRTELQTIL